MLCGCTCDVTLQPHITSTLLQSKAPGLHVVLVDFGRREHAFLLEYTSFSSIYTLEHHHLINLAVTGHVFCVLLSCCVYPLFVSFVYSSVPRLPPSVQLPLNQGYCFGQKKEEFTRRPSACRLHQHAGQGGYGFY